MHDTADKIALNQRLCFYLVHHAQSKQRTKQKISRGFTIDAAQQITCVGGAAHGARQQKSDFIKIRLYRGI